QGAAVPDADLHSQRVLVDAFLAAARVGDLDGLLAVLDPPAALRAHPGVLRGARGARAVAEGAVTFARLAESVRPAIVNGAPGWLPGGRPLAVMGFTGTLGKVVEIGNVADPVRLGQIDLKVLED